jgi:DNA-binding beta-propeller fold protein YncE
MTTPLFPIKFENAYRTEDSLEEELSPPSGLCFTNEGNLLLADDFNHRIQVYDPQFNLLHSFGSKGKEPGQFQYPKGIAVDPEGNIFVADCWNHRIQKFDAKGNPLLTFGTCGDGIGELNEPYDILIEPSGDLVVVERYNHRIQFFNSQGISLGCVGDRGTVLEEQLAELQGTPAKLLAPILFEFPTSIAKDSQGNFFITDSGNHRVRKFNSQWQEIMSFGEQGTGLGQFQYPLCVSIAPNDLLYIADLNNERIQVFSPFGQYLFAIDGVNPDQNFEAPCLTAIDLKGCLYLGFTFNTRIFKYLIPLASQNTLAGNLGTVEDPNPYHIFYQALSLEQEKHPSAMTVLEKALILFSRSRKEEITLSDTQMEGPLLLSHLSAQGATASETALDLACHEAQEQLKNARKKVVECFLSWQEVVSKSNELLHEEQRKIVRDPEGVRDFNRELYIAEQEDKKFFRLTRNEFYSYRKTVQQFSQFICNLIESKLPGNQFQTVNDILLRQTEESLSLMKEYFGQKEKSEESMVRILGESQGEEDKLSIFLNQYYSNCRIMDLQQHLQFELRSHWHNFRSLARINQNNVGLENLAGKLQGDPSAFEDVLKILIGFHEDWQAYPNLEKQFLNTVDNLVPSSEEAPCKKDLTLEDLSPVPYDSENLDFIETQKTFLAEAAPLIQNNEKLTWGCDQFQFPKCSDNKEELAQCALKLMQTQSTYQDKFQELILQLDDMAKKRKDLNVQLKQAKSEDKISPITISDNIAIVQFQINLIRRMVMSLDINQSLNLYRLILAGAFLSLVDNKPECSEIQQFLQSFNNYHSEQDRKIRKISTSRKLCSFKLSQLNNQASELKSSYNIAEISDSLRIEDDIDRAKIDLDQLEFEYQRVSKIKNILGKLVEFRNRLSPSEENLKTTFREIQIIEKAGAEIGQTLAPQGIHYNQDGDLLVADYEHHHIYSYSQKGLYQFHFGGWGNAPTCLQNPVHLTTDSKNAIYVIDEMNREIKKFDREGKFLLQFGRGNFGPIFSLSTDAQDHVWVAEPEHNRVRVFDSQGKVLQEKKSNLKEPVSVYCLPKGEYLVGDRSEALLKHFDAQDNLIHETGKADLGVDEIYFLAWHPNHGIFASDFWNSQIVHLTHQLEVRSVYRKPGKRSGQLGKVGGLSIFNDQLAIANFDGGKVQIFDLSTL